MVSRMLVCFGAVTLLQLVLTTKAQSVASARGVMSWSFDATGVFAPSYEMPAKVSLQVTVSASGDTDTITGTELWEVKAFGNTASDGSEASRYDERTDFINALQRAQPISPTDNLAFDADIEFDLSGLACGSEGPFFCVEVTRADGASTEFEITGKWIGCQSTPCFYPDDVAVNPNVCFTHIIFDMEAMSVPLNEPADIFLMVIAYPDINYRRHLQGTGLWKMSMFGSKTADGSGDSSNRYDEHQQILTTAENCDKSITASGHLEFIVWTQFLMSGVGCVDFPYLCVTLAKGDNPVPDFELQEPMTICRTMTCLYPGESPIMTARFSHIALSLGLPANFDYDTATDIELKVVMTPRQPPDVPTDTIAGNGLWRVAIFGNTNEDGSDETRFDERTQVLSHAEQGATLSPEGMLEFDLTTSFRIGRVGCDGLPYFCVEFSKGDSPVPDFILPNPVVGCVELPCTYQQLPIARLDRITWSITSTGDGQYGSPVDLNLNVQIYPSDNPATEVVDGSRLWELSIYGSPTEDGSGDDRFDEAFVLTECQRDKTLRPTGPLEFKINTKFTITGVGCPDYPYLCVKFAKGDDAEPDFLMNDALIGCAEVTCTPSPTPSFIVSGLNFMVKPGNPTELQSGQSGTVNYLKFILEVTYDKLQYGEISSPYPLWKLALWASSSPDGSGPQVSAVTNTLTGLQAKRTLVLGDDFTLSSVRNRLDLTDYTCADVGYVCVELDQGSVQARDVYEFLTEPASYVPRFCLQMGCTGP